MDQDTFMDFYSDMSDEDPEYIQEYLTRRGIDVDKLQEKLLDLLAKHKAALQAEKESAENDGSKQKPNTKATPHMEEGG
ncbi:MAG TPA: hypothetical protein VIS48_06020 [Candidatus Kryptonia bacterium]